MRVDSPDRAERGLFVDLRLRIAPCLCLPLLLFLLGPAAARADFPFPACGDTPGCTDPADYGSYLFADPANPPDDLDLLGDNAWKYLPGTGLDVIGAWSVTTGRPDVVLAVLDSGIRWSARDVRRKVALNVDELPLPIGCLPPTSPDISPWDCNGDGAVTVDDFSAQPCPGGLVVDSNGNGNGLLDAQDLILLCSDGVDGVSGGGGAANGYVDDIAGWDFYQDDNDPFDDVDYGHGTGEAEDSTAEADNGDGFPGVAPNAMFLPLRVGDSFVALDSDFAQAVVYAVDNGAALVQEALGTISRSPSGQQAVDYAYAHGVPVMASAADEQSRHHNYPAAYDHTIWLNSIRDGDDTFAREGEPSQYDLLNGCTNYGGKAWVAIPSTACSSEATGRGSGLAALLISHGRNLVDAGLLEPWDAARGVPYSAEEIRQILRASADDIDREGDLALNIDPLLRDFLSRPDADLFFGASRFPTQAGWDQYTGFGRPDAVRMLEIASAAIPPEADLASGGGGLRFFDVVDPGRGPVALRGTALAERSDGWVEYSLQVGCGVQPRSYREVAGGASAAGLRNAELGQWSPADTASECGIDPAARTDEPDAYSVTLRLVVRDRDGRTGIDRRTVAIHRDATWRFEPVFLGASGEASPALADVDRDGALEIVYGTGDGALRVLRGRSGESLRGFPVWTDPVPVHPSPAYEPGGPVAAPHEAIVASVAADDLDGDGRIELVAASTEGRLYVWSDQGERMSGFPVATDPARSAPANRDPFNDADPGILAAPTLADLDGNGDLEIIVSALDGHLYVWHHDGAPGSGFPVRIADRARVAVDEGSGALTPRAGSEARRRLTKLIGSPAVGDLDADGSPEILVTSNEEYGGARLFGTDSVLVQILLQGLVDLGDDFSVDVSGRMYAVHADGRDHPGGPFRSGWPVEVPLLASQLLPNVATGTPGSPALADLDPGDDDPSLAAAIFGTVGPTMLFGPDGSPLLGVDLFGSPNGLAVDFPNGGFGAPQGGVPAAAGSGDAPFFGALGSGAFGDLDGDGLPEYVAPTGGLRKLIDVAAPGQQAFGDHQITAWNPRSGRLFGASDAEPVFPRVMDDMQFLSSPSIADVSGDGRPDVVQGSGAYLIRAYTAEGQQPEAWPKFTHGWSIDSPTVGDVDGDGLSEVVVLTREGVLFVWDTPAPATASAISWQGFGGDRRNTGLWGSGVPVTAEASDWVDGLLWDLRSLLLDIRDVEASSLPGARALAGSRAAEELETSIAALAAGERLTGLAALLNTYLELIPLRELGAVGAELRLLLRSAVIEAAMRAFGGS